MRGSAHLAALECERSEERQHHELMSDFHARAEGRERAILRHVCLHEQPLVRDAGHANIFTHMEMKKRSPVKFKASHREPMARDPFPAARRR